MNLTRSLAVSLDVLMGHKLRTLLSSSGIGIGVAAVVLMVGAGRAAEEDVVSKVQSMGTNLLVVQAGRFRTVGTHTHQVAHFTTLKPQDVRLIERHIRGITAMCGFVQRGVTASYQGVRTRTVMAGAGSEIFTIRNITADSGALFTKLQERTMARVAVVGPTVVTNVFGGADPVGQTLEINKVLFKVIGVASARGQDLSGFDQDDVIYVPLSTAMNRVFKVVYLQSILVQADGPESMRELPDALTPLLRRSHRLRAGKEDDFTIQDQAQIMKTEQETTQAFTVLVGSVAGVSLFTGGVGILAVMLISIRERTREIGLRRAIGARRRDVLLQFLLEAGVLAGMGGFAGILIGLAGNLLTCRLAGWPVVWPWSATLYAFGISVAMGVLFGLYPARKAARLDPATALHAAA
ncbi:MAG: ABC transporter permease [Acidobacteriota bacterium]